VTALYHEAVSRLPGRGLEAAARGLLECLRTASARIQTLAQSRPALRGMGTTATVCTIAGQRLIVAHVGDSRAYLFRAGQLVKLTRDQTLTTLLIERGQLMPEQADDFEFGHVILQALGSAEGIEVDLGALGVSRGDVLLLCSDGLYGCVEHGLIGQALASGKSSAAIADELLTLALEAGAPDNVSLVLARLGGDLPERADAAPILQKLALSPEPVPGAFSRQSTSSSPRIT
jgi:PPM family protein phosphatase